MVPQRLKAARRRAGLTQEKLGVLAGIDESTARSRISQYENGTYTPAFTTMCALARVLNVPECYFYILDEGFAEKVLGLYESEITSSHNDRIV
ncbi:helix-turn-helix transcriptional regulator [Serratia nevei]|uniref:helix-turn-helix transcriptional regulator n=1 Tax=Serratia nevei TaxID=2703794 RepID=UPI003FA74147